LKNLENWQGKLPVSLLFVFLKLGFSEPPARIYREALVDPHEDMVVVDDFIGTGKDGDPVKGGFVFKDFELHHVSPGFQVVGAQDSADRDVCPHELVPHRLRHSFQGGEGPGVDENRISGIEFYCPVVYVASFFYPEKVSQFLIGFDHILRLGFYSYRFSGHYFEKKSYGTVSPTTDPEAGGNLKAFQFFKEISFQNYTSR